MLGALATVRMKQIKSRSLKSSRGIIPYTSKEVNRVMTANISQ